MTTVNAVESYAAAVFVRDDIQTTEASELLLRNCPTSVAHLSATAATT